MNIITDWRQRHLEAFETEYFTLSEKLKGKNSDNGAVVRAAIKAGIITGVSLDAIGDMSPREVGKMARAVNAQYVEVMTVDPN